MLKQEAFYCYRKDFQGIPDTVLNGDGFTVELMNDEVVVIDIYDAKRVLPHLLKYGLSVVDDSKPTHMD
jgi:hypothetical protein